VPDEAVEVLEIDWRRPAISKPGDLSIIGKHRLLCGNALDKRSYDRLLGHEEAALIFADPAYNLAIVGNVSGRGKTKHSEFPMASGEMSRREFTTFRQRAF
jgi:DNA modification methylase